MLIRNPYPSEVSDADWAFVAPYRTRMTEPAPPRQQSLPESFHGLRWRGRGGAPWQRRPHEWPPWEAVYQQPQRWLKADCLEAIVQARRAGRRVAHGRDSQPTAALVDGRTRPASGERGPRAGDDGPQRRHGSTVPMAVETLGSLRALWVTPATAQEREPVAPLAEAAQEVTEQNLEVAFVAPGDTGKDRSKPHSSTGCGWKGESGTRPNEALCCCPAAGG